jgi:heptosyltransferase III
LFDGPEGTIAPVATMTAPASRHVLVIHPGALGDVLQAVPALRALAALDGGARVSLAAQPRLAGLLAGAGAVDEALSFDSLGLEGLFADGPVSAALADRLGGYHAVVSWFGARAAPYPERLRALAARAIVAPPVPELLAPDAAPVWRHLLSTLAPLGVKPNAADRAALVAPLAVSLAWRERARAAIATLRMGGKRPVLLAHPGAGGEWKRWPPARFADVIALAAAGTGCTVLLHEGPADAETTADVAARLDALGLAGDHARLVEPDLPLLAGALAEARAYLGGDSGVSHLAAAVGAPAVILFPDATREAWSPWSPRALALPAGDDAVAVSRAAAALVARLTAARP